MKKNVFLFLSIIALSILGCSKDDDAETLSTIQAAFMNPEVNLSSTETTVNIAFSSAATSAGAITLNVTPTNVSNGIDFSTNPAITGTTITVPFNSGATNTSFTFTKIIEAIEGETKNVKFTIASTSLSNIEIPSTTNYTQLNFNETAITENTTIAENGGNNLPNQVYIDLSSGTETAISRTSWELGFHSGNEFRVVLNPAINKLAVKQLATTNIDEVQAEDPNVTTGNYIPSGSIYIDNPYGNLSGTSIAEISSVDSENKVYLVNLGQDVSTTTASGTGTALTGDDRGWKKIRILRSGNNYKLQYANIDATTHNEVIISKNAAFNHTFYSLITNNIVNAEPEKDKWDLNITPFMNYTQYNGENVSYFFSDVVITNALAGTAVYSVSTTDFSYTDFNINNVNSTNFSTNEAKDRRAIGSNWRSTYPAPSVKTNLFYVLKDTAGNIYKIKFTSMLNNASERGTTTFEYSKLN
ncbi:HmuY family protein [Flavobacterium sp. 316]|uniref:HmuY family protein n=1 Tax=Flavobacterium sp. 316 TaxID=1603293 RepID=UPI000698B9AC|nr:HmuY family protein [Flavobacterium sp. 316]